MKKEKINFGLILIGIIILVMIIWIPKNADAFFWQNEPDLTTQEIYQNDAQTRELARQVFVQATITALKSQKDYAKEKATTAINIEDTGEVERLTEVIKTLNREIKDVETHTKIVFMRVQQ